MRSPVVDVVIDNLDYARFLGAAIDSALGQTHPQTRVTVVDDGSRDDSVTVARSYGNRIRVIAKPNGGQASALNAGFAATAGDLVLFLDADDVLCRDVAAAAVEALSNRSGAARAVFRAEVIDAAGMPTGRVEPSPHLPLSGGDLRSATLTHPFDLVWPPLSAQVFTRSALAKIMPIPESDFRTLADWYVAHATSLVGDVVAVERVGVRYREHGANAHFCGAAVLCLEQIRSSIVHEERVALHLERIGRIRGHIPARRTERSTATVARRLISLRLDRERHPIDSDRRSALVLDGICSIRRRSDLGWRVRGAMMGWFFLLGVAPRALARRLGELFVQPSRRGPLVRRLGTASRSE
ncbi:MAG: glycosyltransferase family 2 protein [Chloroflexota bacterium]|nr:glycosyltransferase family 2 protein [Chloroflexota bacterium]